MPWPPALHMVASAVSCPRAPSPVAALPVHPRARMAPSGWRACDPRPPSMLVFSQSSPSSCPTAMTGRRTPRFSSTTPMSESSSFAPRQGLLRRRHRADAHDSSWSQPADRRGSGSGARSWVQACLALCVASLEVDQRPPRRRRVSWARRAGGHRAVLLSEGAGFSDPDQCLLAACPGGSLPSAVHRAAGRLRTGTTFVGEQCPASHAARGHRRWLRDREVLLRPRG